MVIFQLNLVIINNYKSEFQRWNNSNSNGSFQLSLVIIKKFSYNKQLQI